MHSILGFILGGGRGAGLYPLTKFRSAPAVPVAGKYRLIDIPISNCINSDIQRIYILTQFLSVSLHRHITNTYKFAPFRHGFVEVLAAQQTNEAADWYQGTADALRHNIRYLKTDTAQDVLILSGDGLYRMDYRELVREHRQSGADLTIAVVPVQRRELSSIGVIRIDQHNRILELVEKPQDEKVVNALRVNPAWLEARKLAGTGKEFLANMGVYIVRREVLLHLLEEQPQAVDLVTQLFTRAISSLRVQAFHFDGYWQDLDASIRAYHEAHLALAHDPSPFDFHSPHGVIYTRMRNLPASRIDSSALTHTLVSDGCVIAQGVRLEECVIGQRMHIGQNAHLRRTIVSGADRYESPEEQAELLRQGIPLIGIGEGSVISNAIIDKDCRIGKNVRIINESGIMNAERDNYVIRDGIIVIPKGTTIKDDTVI